MTRKDLVTRIMDIIEQYTKECGTTIMDIRITKTRGSTGSINREDYNFYIS